MDDLRRLQVMEAIRKVYQYDDQTKGMSDQKWLEYHRKQGFF